MNNYSTPPRGLPEVILKEKTCYLLWIVLQKNFPRVERLGLGQKIENSFLSLLELTFTSAYLQPKEKIIVLSRAISRLDILKFFMQLSWESKLISTEQHIEIGGKLEDIGRQLGGWKKGLEAKLSQPKAGRETT